jgi:hypothetical protein
MEHRSSRLCAKLPSENVENFYVASHTSILEQVTAKALDIKRFNYVFYKCKAVSVKAWTGP